MGPKEVGSCFVLGDLLQAAWEGQQEYQIEFERLHPRASHELVKDLILGITSEAHELLNETAWRPHRKEIPPNYRDNVADELADISKYILLLWQHFGFSPQEALQAVLLKNEVMAQRFRSEWWPKLEPGTRVLVSDLDGVLADFYHGFRAFWRARGIRTGIELPPLPATLDLDLALNAPFPEFYAALKEFELWGGYRRLPPYEDGTALVRKAQQAGWIFVAVSSRPKEISRIWSDTWAWLVEQEIQPERLALMARERILLISSLLNMGCKVVALEDDPSLAEREAALCPVIVRKHDYNKHLLHDRIWMVEDMTDVDLKFVLVREEEVVPR